MSYNLNALINDESRKGVFANDCRIVFANNYTAAMDLKEYFLAQNPNYISEINENLVPSRKAGPFRVKNKKSIFNLLYNTQEVKETLSVLGVSKTASYVKEELEKMDLQHCGDLPPAALNRQQLQRASHLYEIFDGKDAFLLCDSTREKSDDREKRIESKRPYLSIATYMDHCEKCIYGSCKLVWITDLTVDEMLELLGDNVSEDDYSYSFFALDGHDVVELDKKELLSDFVRSSRVAELAYENARYYDRYYRGQRQYYGKDDLKKAFDLYKAAAEMGHPGAQLGLADLYSYGHDACTKDYKKALYWYLMAEYDEDHLKGISAEILKEVHTQAPKWIRSLVLQVPDGKEMLRKYAADDAQRVIKEAEAQRAREEKDEMLQKLADGGMDEKDQEYFNQKMNEAMKLLIK